MGLTTVQRDCAACDYAPCPRSYLLCHANLHVILIIIISWHHPTCCKMRYRQEVLQRCVCEKDHQVQYTRHHSHAFFLVAVETLGPLSDEAHSLIAEIDRRATLCTADPWESTFLYQHISVAIQRFNAVCLANTFTVFETPS